MKRKKTKRKNNKQSTEVFCVMDKSAIGIRFISLRCSQLLMKLFTTAHGKYFLAAPEIGGQNSKSFD